MSITVRADRRRLSGLLPGALAAERRISAAATRPIALETRTRTFVESARAIDG